MNALQVLHLFLNPFAGRANRQQFLFFVLIFLSVLLWLEVAMNAYDYDKSYDSLRFMIGLGGFYFVLVGSLRRFRDSRIDFLEGLRLAIPKAPKYIGIILLIILVSYTIYFYVFFGFGFYFTLIYFILIIPFVILMKFSCVFSSYCLPGLSKNIDLSGSLFLLNVIVGLIFFVVPLLLPNNRLSNKYGPPPVGFNLRTMLKATYPAALAEQFEAIEQEQHEARERELQQQLERAKAARKAKTIGASPYIEFKGRG